MLWICLYSCAHKILILSYADKKKEGMTRDAYTQSSTFPSLSSSNLSTILTPSIIEISTKLSQDSLNSEDNKTKLEKEVSARFFSLS